MAKVTSKLQITLPKRIADAHRIQPGDDIEFQSVGEVIRILPANARASTDLSIEERLRLFDESTERLRIRASRFEPAAKDLKTRDWTREELYRRGSSE